VLIWGLSISSTKPIHSWRFSSKSTHS
jgi:hypothetical protein